MTIINRRNISNIIAGNKNIRRRIPYHTVPLWPALKMVCICKDANDRIWDILLIWPKLTLMTHTLLSIKNIYYLLEEPPRLFCPNKRVYGWEAHDYILFYLNPVGPKKKIWRMQVLQTWNLHFGIKLRCFHRTGVDGFQVVNQFAGWPNMSYSLPLYMKT